MLLLALPLLSWLGGCAGPINPSVADIRNGMSQYEVARSPVQIDASATVEAVTTEDASIQKHLRESSNYTEAAIKNHALASAETLANDMARSGLFTRILPAGDPAADYHIKIHNDESRFPDWVVRITIQLIDAKTNQAISTRTKEVVAGMTPYRDLFPGMMAELKSGMMNDLVSLLQRRTALAASKSFQNGALADLLAGSDPLVAVARERNRAIIAAKTTQLPSILRNTKTDELTALVVKIEQTILDLNHNSELAKDRAQQAAASGASRQVDDLRELAISYRERIELLKPIATAIKEEIANRNR